MNDINEFQELVRLTLDIAKSQDNKIKMNQVLEIFKDMELNENQNEQIIAYLAANKINVVDYVKPMKTFEQKELQTPENIDDTDTMDDMESSESKLSPINGKSINMDDEKDSEYLAQYLNELKCIRKGTKEEITELLKNMRSGDRQAKERFIEIQLPTVAAVACEYKGKGMKAEDLIQEGNMALLQSLLELPDIGDDDAILKYIYDYVRNSILESLDEQQESDRIENELMEKSNHIFEALKDLEEELGHKANIHELAHYLKITEDELADILELSADSIKLDSHNHSHQHNHEEE